MNFFKDGKLPGKGTAAVICFCLAAVAALGIFSYNRSARELAGELSGIAESGTVTASPEPSENANAPAKIPMETTAPIGSETAAPEEIEDADVPAQNIPIAEDAFGKEPPAQSDASGKSGDTGALEVVVRPVAGEIINPFSGGELVKSKTLDVWKTHDGIDVAADPGTAVKSMSAGVVTSVIRDPLMGVTVTIDHGSGYEGVYCNLADETKVSAGDPVEAGTVIGEVGNTAEAEISEPPHLHFGVRKNNSWVNPADVLSGEGS